MRLKQVSDNGNVAALNRREVSSHNNFDNRSWVLSDINSQNIYNSTTRYDNSVINSNFDVYESRESACSKSASVTFEKTEVISNTNAVFNRQYGLNIDTNINFLKSYDNTQTANLEGVTEQVFASRDSFLENADVSLNTTPIDEERAFEQSDTDEMSEHSSRHPVPRGIVNPNYPGFQHLAHTLQDYSANIDNFYHSENDMTDDDIDLEISESVYESESNQNVSVDCQNINNNNNGNHTPEQTLLLSQKELILQNEELDSHLPNEIPDLLKTISMNNNNIKSLDYDLNCSDADIDNNFHTKDIIGDFNKEIEDEIKQLLNYNINIEEDLEELRKDIKDTFTKPIENTINNISDVVNQVIKKLVEETQSDTTDNYDNGLSSAFHSQPEENKEVNQDNETNARTEMNLSRPTFLLLENSTDGKITDAFLSDGKDEINLQYENSYDTEVLSNNVERTIQQLSTELRKIIPKLEEMRESDRLWNESIKETAPVLTDGNSNEIASCSKRYNFTTIVNTEYNADISSCSAQHSTNVPVKEVSVVTPIEPKATRSRPQTEIISTKSCFWSAQSNTSVRKSESSRECDLGSFDVYNIETALPKLDFDAIESHLKAAKEAERRVSSEKVSRNSNR